MAKNNNKNDNKIKKNFFKDFKAELKKVIWPTPKQLVTNTTAVVVSVIIAAIIVFALDSTFDLLDKYGVSNLQSVVDKKFNDSEESNTDSETESSDEVESGENSTEVLDGEEVSIDETNNETEATNPEQ